MALGQAVGTAAALSIKEESNPRVLNPDILRQTLIDQGSNLVQNCFNPIASSLETYPIILYNNIRMMSKGIF